jgi:hypothetical protein
MPKFQPSANRREGRIGKNVAISIPFSEGPCFCLYWLKVNLGEENFKIPQQFFSYFCTSFQITFSQTQTGATVPLKGRRKRLRWRESTVVRHCLICGNLYNMFGFLNIYSQIINLVKKNLWHCNERLKYYLPRPSGKLTREPLKPSGYQPNFNRDSPWIGSIFLAKRVFKPHWAFSRGSPNPFGYV